MGDENMKYKSFIKNEIKGLFHLQSYTLYPFNS